MRLKGKLTLVLSLLSLVTALSTVLALRVSERRHLLKQADEERWASLDKFSRVAAESIIDDNEILRLAYAKTFMESAPRADVAYAALLDASGLILMHSDFFRGDYSKKRQPPAEDELRRAARSQERAKFAAAGAGKRLAVFCAPVKAETARLATAVLAFDQDVLERSVDAAQKESLERFLIAAGAAGLLSLVLAFLLSLTLTRPIERLRTGTKAIGEGKLDTRLAAHRKDELGELAADFNVMAQKLTELDKLKDEFLAKITHDLRNPLSAIMGHTDLLAAGILGKLTDKQLESVETCRRNELFLNDLINNILDITKLQAGKMPLEPVQLSFHRLASSVVDSLRVKADEFGVQLTCAAVPEEAVAWADAQALKRVLSNFVSNALKFTPSGGSVTIGWQGRPDGSCRAWVSDTGIGVPAEKLSRLFQKFTQIAETRDKVRPSHGTGLGLAICKEIVEAHGGTVGVESQSQKGTTFWFTLPAAPRPA